MTGTAIETSVESSRALSSVARKTRLVGSALAGPALILVVAINVLPAFFGFYLSLRKVFFFGDEGFTGLDNYIALFSNPFAWQAIWRSLVFTFGSLVIAVPLALVSAMGIRRLGRWGSILLTVLLVPWAMSPIVVALLWKWILVPSPGGLIGSLFVAFGVPPQDLLTDPVLAMPRSSSSASGAISPSRPSSSPEAWGKSPRTSTRLPPSMASAPGKVSARSRCRCWRPRC